MGRKTKGTLIVIESGTDGAGKATQAKLLFEALKRNNVDTMKITAPAYNSISSGPVRLLLNGDLGSTMDTPAVAASSFYGVDRYCSYRTLWKDLYDNGGVVVADRYTTSNMTYQAAKISDVTEKEEILGWIENFEYNDLKLPIPDVVVFLNMPPHVSANLRCERVSKMALEGAGNSELTSTKDIYESDKEYQISVYENSLYVAKTRNWLMIDCFEDDRPKSIDAIHADIVEKLKTRGIFIHK